MNELDGRVVAVTGAASGIGEAIALAAARDGAKVVLGDLDARRVEQVASAVRESGGDAVALQLDVADERSVCDFVAEADARWSRLDGLVCSAGISTFMDPGVGLQLAKWQRLIDVNLTGTYMCVKAAIDRLVDRGQGGSIIAVTSSLAVSGQRQGPHYSASKAGVTGMMKSFALDYSQFGIRLNCLAPGVTDTPLLRASQPPAFLDEWAARVPSRRIGRPDDLAGAACFLLSDQADWITGQTMHVNGGSVMP